VISAVDLIIQIERTAEGTRRVWEISRVQKEPTHAGYAVEKLFCRDRKGRLVRDGGARGGSDG
jgi:Flp pilus assembly CpaF family ATPase